MQHAEAHVLGALERQPSWHAKVGEVHTGHTMWMVNSGVKLVLLRGGQAEGSRPGLRSMGVCACSPCTASPVLLHPLLYLVHFSRWR